VAQVKIYGLATTLSPIKQQLSDVIHSCVVDALNFPTDKRAHRFFPLAQEELYWPDGRTENYVIIEMIMIEGRSVEAKKRLIRLLFDRISQQLGTSPIDVEICILDSPAHNWGFRGMHGDEILLNYQIDI
jgi:phenylpyruvate tautomerase PptA (4-oxalocrotonate tautomerase family)